MVEMTIYRINGGQLAFKIFGAQQNAVALYINIADRNMTTVTPISDGVH